MKKVLAVILLFLVGFSLSIEKQVYGPKLLDINDTLTVEINISSDKAIKIYKLEDPIPEHFVAIDYPEACKQSERELVCDFGQVLQGKMNIKYKLKAISTGMGIIGFPLLTYEGGIATASFSMQYAIGKPKIKIKIEGKSAFLPGEAIKQEVVITNEGVIGAKNVSIEIKAGNYSENKTINLNPKEIKKIEVNAGNAKNEGSLVFLVVAKFGNKEEKSEKTVLFVSPGIEAKREVKVVWRVENKKLVPKIQEKIYIKNNGTYRGNYTLSSGESFVLEPGEEKVIVREYNKKAPAVKISLRDERNVLYTTISFKEEEPKIEKGFFVLLYQYVASKIPFWLVSLIALISLYLGVKVKNNMLKVALLTIFSIFALLLISYFSVGAVSSILSQVTSKSLNFQLSRSSLIKSIFRLL